MERPLDLQRQTNVKDNEANQYGASQAHDSELMAERNPQQYHQKKLKR